MTDAIIRNILKYNKENATIYEITLEEFTILISERNCNNNIIPIGMMVLFRNELYIFIDKKWRRICTCDNFLLL